MKSSEEINAFLVRRVSEITDTPADSISTGSPFYRLDIDSMTLVAIATELEQFLERPVESEVMFEAKSIDELVLLLVNESGE